jgi:hypothetical protein
MRSLYLVSCVSHKKTAPAKAKDLYVSDWFRKARLYVERSSAPWFVLSAEHGLTHPDAVIAPYEKTLNHMGVALRRDWAKKVMHQMDDGLPQCEEIVIFAGARYREYLMTYLATRASRVLTPMEGLRIGEQKSWLASNASAAQPL